MTHVDVLLESIDTTIAKGLEVVVATVVKVRGSAYHRPGARIVVPQSPGRSDAASADSVVADVTRKAWWLTASGQPTVRSYATGQDEELADAGISFRPGSNGTVHVLYERVGGDLNSLLIAALRQAFESRTPVALGTVISKDVHDMIAVGDRVLVGSTGVRVDQHLNHSLAVRIERDLHAVLVTGRTTHGVYSEQGFGTIEVLLEYIYP
jgi:xanthine dehydrogenase accessory factor